ncbi:MAG: helix-turn-helix domain-containing protein [Pseudomonadota bacterium]
MNSRIEADQARATLSASVTSYVLGCAVSDILAERRGRPDAAFARQVAMYITHTSFGLSLARVAIAFGRDRSTVAHACHLIEDRRDDLNFDLWLEELADLIQGLGRLSTPSETALAS